MDNQPHLHGQTDELFKRLRKLSNRLSGVTSEICGSMPLSGETPKAVTRTVSDKISECHSVVSQLEDTISRLENSIGGTNEAKQASAAGY